MTKPPARRRHLPTSPFAAAAEAAIPQFAVGDRVSHDRHGLGRIVNAEEGVAMLVDFGGPAHVRVVTPYKGMSKL